MTMTDTTTETGTWELSICDGRGLIVDKHGSEGDAYAAAFEYVLERWDHVFDGPPPDDNRQAVAEYFARVETRGDWFSISVPLALDTGPRYIADHEQAPTGWRRWNAGPAGWVVLTVEEYTARAAAAQAEMDAAALAASRAKMRAKYPTRWPAKYRYLLDAIRDTIDENPDWAWTWFRDSARNGFPKGSFLFTSDAGAYEVHGSIPELAEALGLEPVKATRARAATKKAPPAVAPPVPVVAPSRLEDDLVAFVRKAKAFLFHPELLAEAEQLLLHVA